MSDTATLPNWENLVKKQLKTEDIYPIPRKPGRNRSKAFLYRLKTFGKLPS
jgi:hypothetical protein